RGERGGNTGLALPAVLGRHREPQEPELRALLPALAREAALVVAALEVVVQLLAREFLNGRSKLGLVRCDLEVHGECSVSGGRDARGRRGWSRGRCSARLNIGAPGATRRRGGRSAGGPRRGRARPG